MGTRRVSTVLLAAALTVSSLLHAQAPQAPNITLPPGDATRGKAVFESAKANCLSCHRINGNGSLFGPDLSTVGAPPRGGGGGGRGGGAPAAAPAATPAAAPPLPAPPATAAAGGRGGQAGQGNAATGPTPQQLAQSILDPNALVAAVNRYVVLKMKDGKTITGKLLSIDTFNVQIFDSAEKLANINRENVREMTMTSPMPSYRDKLTTQELADVVSYLMSLKGQ